MSGRLDNDKIQDNDKDKLPFCECLVVISFGYDCFIVCFICQGFLLFIYQITDRKKAREVTEKNTFLMFRYFLKQLSCLHFLSKQACVVICFSVDISEY